MNASWMPGRKFTLLAVSATATLLVWGTALGGRSFGPIPGLLDHVPHADKVGHFVLYGAIMFGVVLLVRTRVQAIGASVVVILLGIGDEFRQRSALDRNFDILDVLSNVGGVALGLLAALLLSRAVPMFSNGQAGTK